MRRLMWKKEAHKQAEQQIRLLMNEVNHRSKNLLRAALGIGVRQDVLAADLVIQGVEAIAGFRLRFCVQRRLQLLNTFRS